VKRLLRKLRWSIRNLYWSQIPGSDPGSRRRNAFSYLTVLSAVTLVLYVIFAGQSPWLFYSACILCLAAFVYFYEVVVSTIFLISSDFKINPIRLIRDIMISALYAIASFAFAFLFHQIGLSGPRGIAIYHGADYLYFSMVTFSSLGYGDFSPVPSGRIPAAIEALFGITYT